MATAETQRRRENGVDGGAPVAAGSPEKAIAASSRVPALSASPRLCGETSRRRHQRGVTLVEILVVVTIIGLIAGVSYPSISSGMDSIRMNTATRDIASFLNSAVTRTERFQRPVELLITPAARRFQMFTDEANFEREMTLPDGIVIESVMPVEGESGEPSRRFLLLPGSAVPGITVQLANQHGTRRAVRLDPMTGFPRIQVVAKQ